MCGFIKGMGTGMIVGAWMGAAFSMDKRRSRKMVHRAVRNMEDMVEKMADAVGMWEKFKKT